MKRWAEPRYPREQYVLISETLDDLVPEEHPIRVLDGFLQELDWSKWEARYHGRRGQPAIHPRLVAGAILYGLVKRIRSSRDLEEASRERLDFRWFLEGRTIDHSTFAGFRTFFENELKDLSGQISRAVVERSVEGCLAELILDGTRIRSNSDRSGARTAERLEKLVESCKQALLERLELLSQGDLQEKEIEKLQAQVESLEAERDKYAFALEEAQKRDEKKRKIEGKNCASVRVPVTDPESSILPNKDGGFAPNYTPTVAVEGGSGAIVWADVVSGGGEESAMEMLLESREEEAVLEPERILADGNFGSGQTLQGLEERGIDAYIPAGGDRRDSNPANRADPTSPVASELWGKLPIKNKRLANSAFIYDESQDSYYCPMGQTLKYYKNNRYPRGVAYRAYRCPGGTDCPLAGKCLKGKTKFRTVIRDQYQDTRDKVNIRMASAEGQTVYARRAPMVEKVFGYVKGVLGIRQFLHRGLRKVRMEWIWICTAFNLRKLLNLFASGPKTECQAQTLQSTLSDSFASLTGHLGPFPPHMGEIEQNRRPILLRAA